MKLYNITTSTTIKQWQTFLACSSYIVMHESGTYMVRNVITYANNNEAWQLKKEWVSRIVRKENGYKWSVNKK